MDRSSLLCRPLNLLLGLALFALFSVGGIARAADKDKDKFRPVTFDTVDGVTLQGTFYASPKGKDEPTVLLLHKIGSDSHKDGWDKLAEKLQEKGYSVLSFDFRGHGKSTSIDPMKFWDARAYPWNRSYIIGGALDSKGKPKESISKEKFREGYYPYLVNDISAAKTFLDERNDAGECNSQALLLIGAEDAAALGALWMHSEWNRFSADTVIPNPRNPALPPLGVKGVDKDSQGKGQYCAIWLSMSTSLGGKVSVGASVKSALKEVGRDKKIPQCFFYGEKDENGQARAKDMVQLIKGGAGADDKWKFTLDHAVPGAKLTGSGLLRKDLKTEELILTYLEKLRKNHVAHDWSKIDSNGTAYVWTVGNSYRVAKEGKGKVLEPIPLILVGITQ